MLESPSVQTIALTCASCIAVTLLMSNVNAFSTTGKVLRKISKAIEEKGEPEMFEDVHLPKDLKFKDRMKNFFQFEKNTNTDVTLFLLPTIAASVAPDLDIGMPSVMGALDTGANFCGVEGLKKPVDTKAPRDLVFREAYQKIVNRQIKEHPDIPDPCDGYLYFGNQDFTKILPLLCQTSPYWAGALTESSCKKYLEIITYSDDPAVNSKLLDIMRSMLPVPERRINLRFNKDMTINKITSYETGEAVTVPEKDWNYYVTGIMYNVAYFCNQQHTMTHVYHYYMTAAITYATKHNKSMTAWATPFDDNIAIKYYEVIATLYESPIGDNDKKGHTGKLGFGGSPAVMPILRDWLSIWGSCKTKDDYVKKFLLKDLYATAEDPEEVMKTSGILTELNKHFDLIDPFAKELSDAMKADDEGAFKKAETTLEAFLSDCGEGLSSIDSISSWVTSMACTGITHGSTLGYSRLVMMPEFMRWRNIKAEKFDNQDASIMVQTAGVLVGMTMGRHVFTDEINYKGMWDTSKISPGVKAVLNKYDGKADELKLAYQHEIEKRDDFREYGWILSEHCPDGYDGKQHTMTSYI